MTQVTIGGSRRFSTETMYGKIFLEIPVLCGMTNLAEKLDTDYLLGCIKYKDSYVLYALPLRCKFRMSSLIFRSKTFA